MHYLIDYPRGPRKARTLRRWHHRRLWSLQAALLTLDLDARAVAAARDGTDRPGAIRASPARWTRDSQAIEAGVEKTMSYSNPAELRERMRGLG